MANDGSARTGASRALARGSVAGDLAQRALEHRRARVRQESVKVFGGVGDEVDVEGADALLEHAPHRLPEVGHDPHQPDTSKSAPYRSLAVVRGEDDLVLI